MLLATARQKEGQRTETGQGAEGGLSLELGALQDEPQGVALVGWHGYEHRVEALGRSNDLRRRSRPDPDRRHAAGVGRRPELQQRGSIDLARGDLQEALR